MASEYTNETIQKIIQEAREDSIEVYNNLIELNPYENDVTSDLKKVANMFNMEIEFEDDWLRFIGLSTA